MNCTKEPLEMKLKGSKAEGCQGTRVRERDRKQIAKQTDCKKKAYRLQEYVRLQGKG